MELRTTALRLTKQILKFIAFIVCNKLSVSFAYIAIKLIQVKL